MYISNRLEIVLFVLVLAGFSFSALANGDPSQPFRLDKKDYVETATLAACQTQNRKGNLTDGAAVALDEKLGPYDSQSVKTHFIEIDEQGMFYLRDQVDSALEAIRAPTQNPKYVVVYVHGWHHDAEVNDSNVERFKCALARLAASKNIQGNSTHDVPGIYVGWRGESIRQLPFTYLTFWDRKNVSDESGRGSLVEFFARLERELKPSEDRESLEGSRGSQGKRAATNNKLMVVGHSFGASVVLIR